METTGTEIGYVNFDKRNTPTSHFDLGWGHGDRQE